MAITRKEKLELFKNRMDFMGYGNPKGKIWIIGMEEGFSGKTPDILIEKFKATKNKKYLEVVDPDLPHETRKWHMEKAPLQRTLRVLCIILNGLEEKEVVSDKEIIKNYQIYKFGRFKSNHFIGELSPYPSPSIKNDDFRTLYKELDFDKRYIKEKVIPERINLFKKWIKRFNPKAVIFYSIKYLREGYWERIVEDKFKEKNNIHVLKDKFFVLPHPVAYGHSNEYWVETTRFIKNTLK